MAFGIVAWPLAVIADSMVAPLQFHKCNTNLAPADQRLRLTAAPMRAIMSAPAENIGGRHAEIHARQLRDLPMGAALGDRAAREEHRVRASAHQIRQSARLVSRDLAAQEGAG